VPGIGAAIASRARPRDHGQMQPPSADPRAPLFEVLCLYRSLYVRRGPRDSVGVMSVDGAIRYAETLLDFSTPARGPADRSADSTV
jgi:hypothetical protein